MSQKQVSRCSALAFGATLLLAALPGEAIAQAGASSAELAQLSLEDLSNLRITSVSRRAEKLSEAAASIFVITAEDLRRSGASSLPEALRLAPNLQVARVNTGQYAISARGFNNAIGNKLLVLIDGRTVYTPQFSGVNWDMQHVMLEDVDRIEVISGPGATLWGANAVNGVINVITRSAQSTQGALLAAGGGNRESGASMRFGGKLGATGAYRVYGMGYDRDSTRLASGAEGSDRWRTAQAGLRADWSGGEHTVTVQGDGYEGKAGPGPLGPSRVSGANLLARWTRELAGGSSLRVQAYYDRTERDEPLTYRDTIDLFDLEFHHASTYGGHKLLWGGGYRHATDEVQTHFNALNPLPQVFMPARRRLKWSNLFVQDEMALSARVKATLGLKVETNVYTGAEFLPSARLAWTPDDASLVWGALSRAVRAPARLDRDFFLYLQLPGIPLIPVIIGGPDFESEIAYVAEAGYRAHPGDAWSYSLTTFYSFYDKLRSGEPPPAMVRNEMQGSTYGLEAWGTYQLTRDWRLSAGVLALGQNLRAKAGSLDPTGPAALGNDPRFQAMLRASSNPSRNLELDVYLRYVGKLPDPAVPAYTALGIRLGWRLSPDLEVSLLAQGATRARHVEFGAAAGASEIGSAAFLKVLWRF